MENIKKNFACEIILVLDGVKYRYEEKVTAFHEGEAQTIAINGALESYQNKFRRKSSNIRIETANIRKA